jgi:hypothetical protein
MLDAAAEAIQRLGARKENRRVLLLLSESRDRGSETKLPTSSGPPRRRPSASMRSHTRPISVPLRRSPRTFLRRPRWT